MGPLHGALGIAGEALVATVGGGGKTTLLFALARERADEGGAAVLTTTTKFTVPREGRDSPLVIASAPLARLGAVDHALRRGEPVVIAGSGEGERGRVLAVAPDWPARALSLDEVGLVGVEADGAAGRGFKAPADHEPVLPTEVTHVLAVVSVTVLGRPLDAKAVHRPERVRALTGAKEGDPITPEMIAAVLAHENGGRKSVPAGARFIVAVTSADRDLDGAAAIGAACRAAGADHAIAFDAHEDLIRRL